MQRMFLRMVDEYKPEIFFFKLLINYIPQDFNDLEQEDAKNPVRKRENARRQHFLHFHNVF